MAKPVVSSADQDSDAEAPAKGRLVKPLFTPRTETPRDDDSEPPAAAPMLLTMLATVRQQAEERRADRAAAAASSSAIQTSAAADPADTEIRGTPQGPVVVGSTGTIYQVTRDANGIRVSVVDSDGHVVTTSDAIAGKPGSSSSVARPDGSLVVITTNDRATRSTLWSVNSQGEVTKIATVAGFVSGSPQVGSDGSLYFDTNIPFIFSPIGNIDYRTVRISGTNTVRTFAPNSSVAFGGGGSAYLVASQFGIRTVHAFGADGKTKTIVLPGRGSVAAPTIGEDGYAYLPVGVQTLFGGKTTQLYTFRGVESTTRTLTGLPGRVIVKSDGVFLETFTYPGNSDNGDGTTYIYKIYPTAIADPRIIEGRLRSFQVTAEGTIYAVVRDPASTPVVVISPDGRTRSTVDLPGTAPFLQGSNRILGAGEQSDDLGYVTYTADGANYLSVLNPDGSVNRTIALPAGTVPGTVFFGPDGAAYQINQVKELGGAATGQILLTLSNDSFSPAVRGPALDNIADVQFAPDGSGYLVLRNDPSFGVQIVGFDSTGLTGVTQTLPHAVTTAYPTYPVQTLVFGSDGTGYVASDDPADPAVYAFTTTGVTEVLDLDGTPPAFLPVIAPDGTMYVTTSTADGFTVVRTVSTV
ncbi:hypothetical protein FK535_26195 [Mycolicibacterium sp. 018/SC-01/001]|uniref:hypothetical protein n=1 Tax=Mycolicibacterium sp. 018/SC-01/001 TaxID=2592069 RepID=UPI00117F85DC|nr:hypothetical protein [Mycolicibacterium sp. 018/SC-01/001]TRW77884.1 hypothetical protein FK535_26195 [Mycolicibacterium sp. 018/SC-01/001]